MSDPGGENGDRGAGRAAEPVRARAIITGLVQGVSFRWWTSRQAESLGVTGWVRNLDDGSVEVVAEGPRVAVEKLFSDCRRGPHSARVKDVEVSWQPFTGEYSRFAIVH